MLAVVVFSIGKESETYIRTHIDGLAPGRTVVCALSQYPTPSWSTTAPLFALFSSQHRAVNITKQLLGLFTTAGARRVDQARLGYWLSRNHIRVVFCEYLQVALAVLDVCKRLGIPVIAHAHGYDVAAQPLKEGWANRYREQLPLLDEVIVVSDAMRHKVLAFGVDNRRVHIIPCGTAVTAVPQRDAGPAKLLAVGRLVAKKGPLFLLEAFRLARARGATAELVVVGEGPFREPMQQYLRATGLESAVRLMGALPNHEVKRLMCETAVFVQHSITADDGDEEGLPVAILEAMAQSQPVVATRHAGIPEAVHDGRTGFLVEPGDCSAMADRIVQLLTDPKLSRQMGAAARDRVLREFTIERELLAIKQLLAKYANDLI